MTLRDSMDTFILHYIWDNTFRIVHSACFASAVDTVYDYIHDSSMVVDSVVSDSVYSVIDDLVDVFIESATT